MIERDIVAKRIKEFQIQEYVATNLRKSGYSDTKLQKTPLGEKIIIYASRPGLVVGRQGQNIRKLTEDLKELFGLENPQIEVGEVENIYLDPNIVADMIAMSLERFGSQRFKGIMHKTMENVLAAGALGTEIHLSGKLPSARARTWRVYGGYLKKCGDISMTGVRKATVIAQLKSGIIGIRVSIMPPDVRLPDRITIRETPDVIIEEVKEKPKAKRVKKAKKEKPEAEK
ncbi:MAG: 30S ribosomal protein S3 [Candidatus Woesearchaeota archaeon]